jgi:hypothetical protein
MDAGREEYGEKKGEGWEAQSVFFTKNVFGVDLRVFLMML